MLTKYQNQRIPIERKWASTKFQQQQNKMSLIDMNTTKIFMLDCHVKESTLTLNLSHKCSPPKEKSTGQIAAALRLLPYSTGCK